MKRADNLFEKLISDENLIKAIEEVNRTHHWKGNHKPNKTTAWVELTKEERVRDLRKMILDGYEQKPPHEVDRYDKSAGKWRRISEPIQWPDQYIHHALIQILQPVFMRGMDLFCCGSIRGRGAHYGKRAIEKWMIKDIKGTRYCFSCDIRHFYESLTPDVVMERMKHLIKDGKILDLIWRVIKDGIKIGAYPSQWLANTTLQPLDNLIRQSGLCKHYVRYMDNITIFGSNKRKLRQLKCWIEEWLNIHDLELKGDYQIYPVKDDKNPGGRMPDAMGYRYGRGYTLPRKRNLLRIKRGLNRYRKRVKENKTISPKMAESILSRLGQIKHSRNVNIYRELFKGERIVRELKRTAKRREMMTWEMFMSMYSAR